MIHYLLLKFKPGFFSDEVFSRAVDTFMGIGETLEGIEDVQVSRNRRCRETTPPKRCFNYEILDFIFKTAVVKWKTGRERIQWIRDQISNFLS